MIDNSEMPKLLLKYLKYLYTVRFLSLNTITAYKYDLMEFFIFLKSYKKLEIPVECFNIFIFLDVKTEDIISFLVIQYYKNNNSPYTRKRKISSIRGFFNYIFSLYPSGGKVNPTNKINSIIDIVRLPRYLTLEEGKAIQNAFTLKNSRNPNRDNTIITLFLSTGIRVSELVNINISDINFDKKSINIIGKGNKERIVYFNEKCKERLLQYINNYRNKNEINVDNALFINNRNQRLTVNRVEEICKNAYKSIGLEDRGYTVHTLRHTTAVTLYRQTEDILLVKHILGHSNITSTQIYTHIHNPELKKAFDKNPLNFVA